VRFLINKLRRFIAESESRKKNFTKSVEYLVKLQEERDCLVHFVRLANTLLKDEESAREVQ